MEVEASTIFFFKINDFLTLLSKKRIIAGEFKWLRPVAPSTNLFQAKIVMAIKLALDRFTQQKQTVTGSFKPDELPRLKPFLCGEGDADGEISYHLAGMETADAMGRRTRRVKCIISGWFLLADPETLEPERYQLGIKSSLVLVNSEAQLPPLEAESEDEDYVALGEELDVLELVEEEILLDLPFWAIAAESPSKKARKVAKVPQQRVPLAAAEKKISPFAKLAGLKGKEK
jgi:uncharacterized metal-binding protein YceD (DUF177 family)